MLHVLDDDGHSLYLLSPKQSQVIEFMLQGHRIFPIRNKNPMAKRRYNIRDAEDVIHVPSVHWLVIKNLVNKGLIKRIIETDNLNQGFNKVYYILIHKNFKLCKRSQLKEINCK